MIDIENLKEGTKIWFVNNNKPACFISAGIQKYITTSGIQINVLGNECDIPADWCYSSESELIESQIDYWNSLRMMRIVTCEHQWIQGENPNILRCNFCNANQNYIPLPNCS